MFSRSVRDFAPTFRLDKSLTTYPSHWQGTCVEDRGTWRGRGRSVLHPPADPGQAAHLHHHHQVMSGRRDKSQYKACQGRPVKHRMSQQRAVQRRILSSRIHVCIGITRGSGKIRKIKAVDWKSAVKRQGWINWILGF